MSPTSLLPSLNVTLTLWLYRLLLLAPWSDVSRSHAGPLHAPNTHSSVTKNRHSDIIHPSKEYRNTAVSTLLGKLPAHEAYTNPYLSPASLQLPLDKGGAGPHYGFEGFPTKVFITTGTAEVSYDQHLTLAHRMAAGTIAQRPIYKGDRSSAAADPVQLAERPCYPRALASQVDLGSMAASQVSLHHPTSPNPISSAGTDSDHQVPEQIVPNVSTPVPRSQRHAASPYTSSTDSLGLSHSRLAPRSTGSTTVPPPALLVPHSPVESTSPSSMLFPSSPASDDETKGKRSHSRTDSFPHEPSLRSTLLAHLHSQRANVKPLEDRSVILHELEGAPHEYILFDWFEPERSRTWDDIAQWIDED